MRLICTPAEGPFSLCTKIIIKIYDTWSTGRFFLCHSPLSHIENSVVGPPRGAVAASGPAGADAAAEHTAPALRQVPGESGRLLTLKRLIGGRYVKWNFKWRGLYFKSASLPVYAMRCPLEWTGWTVPAGVLAAPRCGLFLVTLIKSLRPLGSAWCRED